ncbi:MAG: GAF domain-containing protein [Nitrospirae bacterium]|nr:GAF domain-containing protein [Nitrospirota bacterium]
MTFRNKIILSAVLGLTLASFVFTFEAVRTENAIMRSEIIKKAELVTELASKLGELPLISGNPELMKKAMISLKNVSEISFIAFYDNNMALLEKEGDVPRHSLECAGSGKTSIVEEDDYFDLCAPVFTVKAVEDIDVFHEAAAGKEIKENVGWVRIGFSKASMKEAANRIIFKGLATAFVFTVINIIIIIKLFTIATRPLTALSNAVKSISKGKYPEIPVSSGDEIGLLTSEFNRMSRIIGEREEMLLARARLSAFVSEIGFVLTESNLLQTTLQRCADNIVSQLDASLARIWTFNAGKNALELQASSGIYGLADSPHACMSAGEFEAGVLAHNLHPHCSNMLDDLNTKDREWARQKGIESFACYPLIVEGGLVGIMEIFAGKHFSYDVFNTLDSVSDEIAIGIQRKQVEEKIVQQNELMNNILNSLSHPFYVINADNYTITLSNSAAGFGAVTGEATCYALTHRSDRPCEDVEHPCVIKQIRKTGKDVTLEHIHYDNEGNPRIHEVHGYPIFDRNGNITQVIEYTIDITDRKRDEEKIKASLAEKEVLLREIHHRVKNNLQIVSSMLHLQSGYIRDEQSLATLRESKNRIDMMALIHEKLYQSKSMARIDFQEYIDELVTSLCITYGVNTDTIRPEIHAEGISFDINTAIPCGLIINELVSNCFKHAFPNGRTGGITVSIYPAGEGKFTLTVSDNGIGLPEGLDFKKTDTLGLKLVSALAGQLDGSVEVVRDAGTTFKITFPEIKYKPR